MNTIHAEFDRALLGASASLLGKSAEPVLSERAIQLMRVIDGSAYHSPGTKGILYACHEVNQKNNVGGRMGNLLFQYAAALGLSLELGLRFQHSYHWLYLPFRIPDGIARCPPGVQVLGENGLFYAYDNGLTKKELSSNKESLFAVVGYRQSFRYFSQKQAQSTIRQHFEFHSYFRQRAQAELARIASKDKKRPVFIGVHIRAGDLLENTMYGPVAKKLQDTGFFKQAGNFFLEQYPNAVFVVRSDNKDYARSVWPFPSSHFAKDREAGDSPFQDMATLVECNHTIFTWGTFGWWSGWLAGGTVVYSELMIAAMANDSPGSFVHSDFIPEGWIGIGPSGATVAGPSAVDSGKSFATQNATDPTDPVKQAVADPEQGWWALCRAHCHEADGDIKQRKADACQSGGPSDDIVRQTCETAFDVLLEDGCTKLCSGKRTDNLLEVQHCKPFKRKLPKPTLFNRCVGGAAAGTKAASGYVKTMRAQWKPLDTDLAARSALNMTVVTASSSNHFRSLLFFVQTFRVFEPNTALVVYDIGLTPCQIQHLKQLNAVGEIRRFEFEKYPAFYDIKFSAGEYAWKPAIIAEMLAECDAVLWLDAGNFLFGTLDSLRARLHQHGFYSTSSVSTLP
jgi:hypothetical protein